MNAFVTSPTYIFIDASLAGFAILRAGLPEQANVYALDPAQNLFVQMADVLAGEVDVPAVHLVTHGAPGQLVLGTSFLGCAELANRRSEIQSVASAMAEDGELLIYGCEVAAGREGRLFIDTLASISGLKVSAATQRIGHESCGGRWELDYGMPLRTKTLKIDAWQGYLAAPALINGLGGAQGFGEDFFDRNDDGNTPEIDITSVFGPAGLKFGSTFYTGTYINNNGMITFGEGFGGFTPSGISDGIEAGGGGYLPLIALFWTDIDTRFGAVATTPGGTSTGSNLVYWDIDTDTGDGDGKKITFTWDDVGLYNRGSNAALAGQIILYDAGSGNMNIEFRYEFAGLYGGYIAAAGWNVGVSSASGGRDGIDYYQISPPADLSWLDTTPGNTGQDGVYRWYLRDGAVSDSAGSLGYSVNTFVESASNDGSIATTIAITLQGDTFTGVNGDDFVGSKATVSNVPAGLTAVLTRTSDTTATFTLTGNAGSHANANDIANLIISFEDAALAGGNASIINNALSQSFRVDFIEASNTAPTNLGNLTLAAVDEDTIAPAGGAIGSLAGLSFVDPDGGATLSGVAVITNTANATTEGSWQYSTNAGTNWYAIGTVSDTEALALSATTLLRFVPVADYYGAPPALTVRALDDSANYFSSTGASETRVSLDASNNGGASSISGNTNTISTSITAVNDAPVVTSGGTTAYVENAPATAVNATLTVTDIDNATLASATVGITGNFQSDQDVLAFSNDGTTMGNIVGTYNATTGVLSLSSAGATATNGEWQTALRAVTYANTSDAPSTANRTISFVVNDGALDSSAATRTVTVASANDAPVIANLNGNIASGALGSSIKLDVGTPASVSDPDSSNFNTGTITVTTASGTADGNFKLDGTNTKAGVDEPSANAGIAASDNVYVGTTLIGTVSATNTGQAGATLTISLNAAATPALISTLLQNLSYTSTSAGARTFNIELTDGDGGTSSAAVVTVNINTPPPPPPPPPADPTPSTPSPSGTIDGATVVTSATTIGGRTVDLVTVVPITSNRQEQIGDVGRADIALYYGDAQQNIPVTSAILPTGVGLTATGLRTPTSNTVALSDLISLINQTAGSTEDNRPDMLDGAQSFLAKLEQQTDKGPLIINSIKFTLAAGQTNAPAQPITITGSTSPVAQGNGGTAIEAIVIDARALPAGSVLELKNVEFAIIIGDNIVVRGGEGANIVFAGQGSQNIVLGEGDDQLSGGDGSDVIGSRSGNDLINGDNGNDWLVGGENNDTLNGGVGNDMLHGGVSDAGTYRFSLNEAGKVRLDWASTHASLAPAANLVIDGQWWNANGQFAVSDPRFVFVSAEGAFLKDVAALYQAVLKQLPSVADLNHWVKSGISSSELAQLGIEAFWLQQGVVVQELESQISQLIQHAWGEAADPALIQAGVDHLNQGGSWADALLYLARHSNNTSSITDALGRVKLAKDWTLKETGWSGNGGNDQLFGGEGNDVLVSGSGNNRLDGGTGVDLAVFIGDVNYWQVALDTAGQIVVSNRYNDAQNIVSDIELFQFGDTVFGQLKPDHPEVVTGVQYAITDFLAPATGDQVTLIGVEDWTVI